MTIWAAKAQFQENEIGSLDVGKKADLTVLDRDLLAVETSDLFNTKVLMTILNGEVVFGQELFPSAP